MLERAIHDAWYPCKYRQIGKPKNSHIESDKSQQIKFIHIASQKTSSFNLWGWFYGPRHQVVTDRPQMFRGIGYALQSGVGSQKES